MATCRIHEKHEYKLCSREAWEQDPEGLCILHSRRKDKGVWGEGREPLSLAFPP